MKSEKRLILALQYPTPMRYQFWWWEMLHYELSTYFPNIIILGEDYIASKHLKTANTGDFSPLQEAILFEQVQIKEYLDLELQKGDVLFVADLSYPGLFSNILFHKRPDKAVAFCHATAKNRYDIFSKVRKQKYAVEKAHANLYDKVIVASEYHAAKLGWKNIKILPLPYIPYAGYRTLKINGIISVARRGIQKTTQKIEKAVKKEFGLDYVPQFHSFLQYYEYISTYRIMLITSKEETFGYQVMDALKNGVIPFAPRCCSYPELLSEKYLYSDWDELKSKIEKVLSNSKEYEDVELIKTHVDSMNFYNDLGKLLWEV